VLFSSLLLSESTSTFLILTTCFFGGMTANFDINVFIIARKNSCKIGRTPYVSGPWAYDIVHCPAGHRPMFSYTDAGRRPYDVTAQEKTLKNRSVPGRLSNSPVMGKSLKSYDVSFICDHIITIRYQKNVHLYALGQINTFNLLYVKEI